MPTNSSHLALALLVAATATASFSSAFFLPPSSAPSKLQRPQSFGRQPRARGAMSAGGAAGTEWALIFDCDGVILEVCASSLRSSSLGHLVFLQGLCLIHPLHPPHPPHPPNCILAQSESLHREAYNAMFKEFEIVYHWDEAYYDELQNKIGGCVCCFPPRPSILPGPPSVRSLGFTCIFFFKKNTHRGIPKMRYYFGEHGWPTSTLGAAPAETDAKEAMLNTLQDRKTDIYKEIISGGTAAVREV